MINEDMEVEMSQIMVPNGVDESIEWKFFKDQEVTLKRLREIRQISLLSVTIVIVFGLDCGSPKRMQDGLGREIVLCKGEK